MGLYDEVLAQAREKEAMAAINVPTSQATQYGAARGMARAKQGARQMFGIEEPAVIQAKAAEARQAKLNNIVSKYSTATTRADFTRAFSELMANGFPEEAAKIQEHLKNMPKPILRIVFVMPFSVQSIKSEFKAQKKAMKYPSSLFTKNCI